MESVDLNSQQQTSTQSIVECSAEVKAAVDNSEEAKIDKSSEKLSTDMENSTSVAPLDLHCSPNTSANLSESKELNDSLNKSTDSKKSTASDSSEKKRRKRKPVVTKKVSAEAISPDDTPTPTDVESNIPVITPPIITPESSQVLESDTETIDKIAQMVSNITQNVIPVNVPQEPKTENPPEPMIEDELEKMFADDPEKVNGDANIATEIIPPVAPPPPKPTKKRKAPVKKKKPAENGKKSKKSEPEKVEEKKPKEKKEKQKVRSDVAPFVQIQKDGSFAIVNQIVNGDDENEKASSKPKKSNKAEKRIRGLHVSTLSNKYDADKRDLTWICVFCKLGPHKCKLGDLFGPYIVNQKSEEFIYAQQDPVTDAFRQSNKDKFKPKLKTPEKQKKKKKSLPTSPIAGVPFDDVFNGMSQVDDEHFEIWFHEDCMVWCDGVHTIGSKLIGLDAAVWSSTRHRCTYCMKNGATIKCLTRECQNTGHFGCAQTKGWRLTDEFKTYCENH